MILIIARSSTACLVVLLLVCSVSAQQTPEWIRVYTFDDSFIELNSRVVVGGDRLGRAVFRWTFEQDQIAKGDSLKYRIEQETKEFDCRWNRFRTLEVSLIDAQGNLLRAHRRSPPEPWQSVKPSAMSAKLASSVCELVAREFKSGSTEAEERKAKEAAESLAVSEYAYSFARYLANTKDFKLVARRFFAQDYLRGYLLDHSQPWLFNLDPAIAKRADRRLVDRFYIASINAGYLTSLYLINQQGKSAQVSYGDVEAIPANVIRLIDSHPYTTTYGTKPGNYEFLAEKINDLERLVSYTNLLERIAVLMRRHVASIRPEQSQQFQGLFEDRNLYQSRVKTCSSECLGLAKGTQIHEVDVPMLRLRIARIEGKLSVVSARVAFE